MNAGLSLGIGNRVTSRLYVGGFVEASLSANISDNEWTENQTTAVLRAGADIHYTVSRGTSGMSTTGEAGPYYPVPSVLWLGVRAGLESTNVSQIEGSFGDIDLGWDTRLGMARTQFGVVVGIGLSYLPSGALGIGTSIPANEPVATSPVNPYAFIAVHFVFGG